MSKPTFTCPACGFDQLERKPYANMPPISKEIYAVHPPYEKHWGFPSYEPCACCGFEFGNDDNAGLGPESNSTFSDYLREWVVDEKMTWLMPEEKPANWNLLEQLQKAGIPLSEETQKAIASLQRKN